MLSSLSRLHTRYERCCGGTKERFFWQAIAEFIARARAGEVGRLLTSKGRWRDDEVESKNCFGASLEGFDKSFLIMLLVLFGHKGLRTPNCTASIQGVG
jgi:hypothetical protein